MSKYNELREYIKNWQNEHDTSFQVVPTDNHACLIFNHDNEINTFIFSDSYLRNDCMYSIPKELLEDYKLMIDQENGKTYYTFDRSL